MKILAVSNDPFLIDVIVIALNRYGYEVETSSLADAVARTRRAQPDLILLDQPDPQGDLALGEDLRRQTQVPLVVLSEQREETAIIRAYEGGADDYIVKPFSPQHLLVRLDAINRRTRRTREAGPVAAGPLVIDDLIIDAPGYRAIKNGIVLPLTPLEFRLLHFLATHRGVLVTAQRLAEHAWPSATSGDMSTLKTHISHIRHKLADAGGAPILLRAVPRTGYILIAPEEGVEKRPSDSVLKGVG